MSLVLRQNLPRPLTHQELDSNFLYLNITEWQPKEYLKGQFVLNSISGVTSLYYCELTHTDYVYKPNNLFKENFVDGANITTIWTKIAGGGGGGAGDKYVVSGSVSGSDLILLLSDGNTVTIDLSTLQATDSYVTGGTLNNSELTLKFNNNLADVIIDLTSLISQINNVVDVTFTGTTQTIRLNDNTTFSTDINNVELDGQKYLIGISNHSFQKITTGWTQTVISGLTYNVSNLTYGTTQKPTKQNIIVVDLNTTDNYHHLVQLPTGLTTNHSGAIYKFIAKNTKNTTTGGTPNLDKFLMVYSNSAPIFATNVKTEYNGSYFLPLEAMESVEMIWDGADFLVTNINKQPYVALNAKDFTQLGVADELFNTNYLERDINNLL
jgi:hypothetical protein